MKKVYWQLQTGFPGCTHEDEIEVDDNATEDEIEQIVKDDAFSKISWEWKIADTEQRDPAGEKDSE